MAIFAALIRPRLIMPAQQYRAARLPAKVRREVAIT